MKNIRLMAIRVRGRVRACGGCSTSPPTIANDDKMRVWQAYGVLPKTPDIQQSPTYSFIVVLLGLSHHDASYNLFDHLSVLHALFTEVRLYSQPAISDCLTKLHRTSRRHRQSSIVRSLDSAEHQSTRTPLRRHRDPARFRCIQRLAATPPRPIFRSSRACPPSPSHCGWPSESSSPPSYNWRFSDALVHVNDADVCVSVCHGRRLEAIILRQVCTHRVYDRMGAPTSTVIKHRVNEMRKPSAVLFAE